MMAYVLLVIGLTFERTAFNGKIQFLLPQAAMLAIGAAAWLAIEGACEKLESRKKTERTWVCDALFWAIVFVVQAGVSYFVYFMPPWDAGTVVENAFDIAAYPGLPVLDSDYFSHCPNNVILTLLDAGIFKLFRAIVGDAGIERCVYALVVAQCAVSACTGLLTEHIAKKVSGEKATARIVRLGYVLMVSASPWVSFPYSDGFALLFPILTLALYVHEQTAKHRTLCWAAMGAAAGLGYFMKPQAVIMMIAIAGVETVHLMAGREWGNLLKRMGAMLAVLLVLVIPVRQALIQASPFDIDPEADIGMLHYAMMGVNEESCGAISHEDKAASYAIESKAERTQMQMETIKSRLHAMVENGTLLEHIRKKTLLNYADGTFAWDHLAYPQTDIEEKDSVISPFLRSIIRKDGSRRAVFATGAHCLWLGLLALCLLAPAACLSAKKRGQENRVVVMLLALIGITMFEMIFEARSRYLFIYVPVYLLAGMLGLRAALDFIRARRAKNKL